VDDPTEVDRTAPTLAHAEIDIRAPRGFAWKLFTDVSAWPIWQPDIAYAVLEQPLAPGVPFRWRTHEVPITSTVYAIDEPSRILWGGAVGDVIAIHEWTFADSPDGVLVTTTESLSGRSASIDPATSQLLLEHYLAIWLQSLKTVAESP